MTAIPLDYTRERARALEGTIADTLHKILISRHADVEMGFGKVVVQGAQDSSVTLPTAGGVFVGITVRDQSVSPYNPNTVRQGDEALIAMEGTINVVLGGTVNAGQGGAFLNADGSFVAQGTAASTGMLNSKFLRSGVAGDIVELRLS